mgnify:CR=1 FL=1
MKELLFSHEDLKEYAIAFLRNFEVPKEDAKIVADVLIEADLRGISSHGFSRLEKYYGRRLSERLIETKTNLETERMKNGIPIVDSVLGSIKKFGKKHGVTQELKPL